MKIRNIIIIAAISMAAQAAMAGYATVSAPLSERVEKLEQMMMGGSESAPTNVNDQVAQLQQEIQTLRGELEAANHQIEKLSQRQRDLYSDLDSRIAQMSKPAAAKAPARTY